jgi:hypothetical protein
MPASHAAPRPQILRHLGFSTGTDITPDRLFPLCKPQGLCYTQPGAKHCFALFLGSSVVEQPAVNRLVAGSNPARGANPPATRLLLLSKEQIAALRQIQLYRVQLLDTIAGLRPATMLRLSANPGSLSSAWGA